MGGIWRKPLSSLVVGLAKRYALKTLVETGTYTGRSTAFAATVFERVVTIEINDEMRLQAMERCRDVSNVEFLLGDSRACMPGVVASLQGPALFWLDGHAGGGNFADQDDCPVLAELEAIAASPYPHFVLVDDARGFLAPPPPPFDASAWPTIAEVLDAARAGQASYCVVIEDTIICAPQEARQDIVDYCSRVRPRI